MLHMIKAVGQRVNTMVFHLAVLAILVVSLIVLLELPPSDRMRPIPAIKMYNGVILVTAEKYDGMGTVVPTSAFRDSSTDQELVLPNSNVLRPLREILKSSWVAELKKILKNMTNMQVNMVVSQSKFLPTVLNWLVAALIQAMPPLENVVIVALDERLHLFLQGKDIPSVYINRWNVIIPNATLGKNCYNVWITRFTIVRLLNYWGYDVANYDSDAVILKNIQPVFDKYWDSDVIGSEGIAPWRHWREPRPTFCMGFSLFRSTKKTDLLWQVITPMRMQDDQDKVNSALDKCGITWHKEEGGMALHGQCRNGPKVTILSTDLVCRECVKDDATGIYVWHLRTKRDIRRRVAAAKHRKTWLLRTDWDIISNTTKLSGVDWLASIANVQRS